MNPAVLLGERTWIESGDRCEGESTIVKGCVVARAMLKKLHVQEIVKSRMISCLLKYREETPN